MAELTGYIERTPRPPIYYHHPLLGGMNVVTSRFVPRDQVLRIRDTLYVHPLTNIGEALNTQGYWMGTEDDLPLTRERVRLRIGANGPMPTTHVGLGGHPSSAVVTNDPTPGERLIGEIMFGDEAVSHG